MKRDLINMLPETRWPAPDGFMAALCMAGGSKTDPSEDKNREELNEELDEGLEETFPASDPVSVSQTTTTGEPGEFRKKGEKKADE